MDNNTTPVLLLTGYLGSGKTTLLNRILANKQGIKFAVIVNDIGEVNIDATLIEKGGIVGEQDDNLVALQNGCICCTLSGTLQSALKNIKKDIDPDIIIVEPTGLALPHKVKELVEVSMIDPDEIYIIGVADVQRFEDLIKKKEDFFRMQMSKADFIMINKKDLAKPGQIEEVTAYLNKEFPGKPVFAVSAKTDENIDQLYEMMR